MIVSLLNKILYLLLFLSISNIVRHGWKIFMIMRDEDIPNKYELTKTQLIFLGVSIAYLLTTIFTGVKI